MKMTRRILSWILAVAMVVTCGVTGLMLPATAEAVDLINGLGTFDDSAKLTAAGTKHPLAAMINESNGGVIVADPTDSDRGNVLRLGKSDYTYARAFKDNYLYDSTAGNYTTLSVDPTKTYTLSFWVYGDAVALYFSYYSVTGHNSSLTKGIDDGSGTASEKNVYLKFGSSENTGWTQCYVTFSPHDNIATENSSWLGYSVYFRKDANDNYSETTGYTYVDDITLVEVSTEEETPAEGIAISPESLELEVGDTSEALTVTVTPENATLPGDVVWSISPESVATIDASTGVVTAVGEGTATVTATCGELTDTMTVTVTAPTVAEAVDLINGLGTFDDSAKLTAAGTKHPLAAMINESNGGVIVADPTDSDRGNVLRLGKSDYTYARAFKDNYLYDSTAGNYTTLSVDPTKTYTLSFWVYGDAVALYFSYYSVTGHNSSLTKGIDDGSGTASEKNVYLKFGSSENTGWTQCYVTFSPHDNIATENSSWLGYSVYFRKDANDNYSETTGYTYVDDITLVEVSTEEEGYEVAVGTTENGSLTVSKDMASKDDIVTVTVTPAEGFMLLPGTLTYTGGTSGTTVKILNETWETAPTWGRESAGNTFEFKMPDEAVTVTAQFVSTATQNFQMDSIGTAIRENGVEEDGNTYYGIRFLTRINLADGFDATADGLTLKVDGTAHEVLKIGSTLTRDSYTWDAVVYEKGGNMKLVDYTASYVDFASVMKTVSTERTYTAQGYIVVDLDDDGQIDDDEYIYSINTKTDSVETTAARLGIDLNVAAQ